MTHSAAWRGGPVRPGVTCVLAPNPSPMTLEGTNTWVLYAPGSTECAVLDPGPLDESHLQAVVKEIEHRGLRCTRILVSHRHLDHTEGAARFAEIVGEPVSFPGRDLHADVGPVALGVDGLHIEGFATPGHTRDSYCFHVPQLDALLTGDTILGRGTTVVAWPDGGLGAYLQSLEQLRELVTSRQVQVILPGHGAPRQDARDVIDAYVKHRHERLDQVRAVLGALPAQERRPEGEDGLSRLVERVVETVYAQVPHDVWPAARQSVRAQLEYLYEHSP